MVWKRNNDFDIDYKIAITWINDSYIYIRKYIYMYPNNSKNILIKKARIGNFMHFVTSQTEALEYMIQ